MSLPYPRVSLVTRYASLWSRELRAGSTEARKDRPAAIVVAARRAAGGEVRVVALVTHEPPGDPEASIRPLPGRPGVYDHGMLPRGLYPELKAGILRRQKALAVRVVQRDD